MAIASVAGAGRADRPGPGSPTGPRIRAARHSCAHVHVAHAAGMDEITILQADVLKVLASPRRLEILHRLAAGPVEVGRLAVELGASQPNVSQHLAIMRSAGMVETERDGREVRYRLADVDIIRACDVMRGVLERRLDRLARLATPPAIDSR
jgi:DNA-binding transcriptional ArsR family regulator